MALIICPECGREISDRAPACIHCGYPLLNQAKSPASETTAMTGATVAAVAFDPDELVIPVADGGRAGSRAWKVQLPCMKGHKCEIKAIRLTRELLKMGLSEAKNFVERDCPVVAENLSLQDAENLGQQYRDIGVEATVVDN